MPTHAKCNLAKSDKSLIEIIEQSLLTLDTEVIHGVQQNVNATTFDKLKQALKLKHRIRPGKVDRKRLDELSHLDDPDDATVDWLIDETLS